MTGALEAWLAALRAGLGAGRPPAGRFSEAVPLSAPPGVPAGEGHLARLRGFASANEIYYSSRRERVAGADCAVYEGDVNRFWLGSVGHAASRAPFSPTWLMSAYALAAAARGMGCRRAVDVGSGDGRIAYCADMLGLEAVSVEVDGALAALQEGIASSTGSRMRVACADAAGLGYGGRGPTAFFVGGLAQMGGEALAAAALAGAGGSLAPGSVAVLAGTLSPKYPAGGGPPAGWGEFMRGAGLEQAARMDLPTAWTEGEPDATPYLFAVPADRNPH